MAATQTNSKDKKLQYKPVDFDVNEIPPDAPGGQWEMSIPRGKCKVQPTREDHFPMIIVPVRLDKTDEEGEVFEKALGTELSVFLVFGGKTPRGERLAKLRVRDLAEAVDADLDLIPKRLDDPENDLQPFIKAIEGKKFTGWTIVQTRKDTGEEVTEVRFTDPNRRLSATEDDDDDSDDEEESEEAPRGRAATKKGAAKKNGRGRR